MNPKPSLVRRLRAWLLGARDGWREPHELRHPRDMRHARLQWEYLNGVSFGQFARSPRDHEQHI